MPTVKPRDFNLALCIALGLDPHKVRSISIRAAAHEPVVVDVEQLIEPSEGDAVLAMLKHYRLMLIDEEERHDIAH